MTTPFTIENPILMKELRTRMRGAKAFWILFLYLGLLSAIVGATYFGFWRNENSFGAGNTAQMGRQFYAVLFMVQAALVGLITPALTSGAISIEKEQRTFEALAVSPIPRRSIVLGKLGSALAFVVLLLVGSLPLVSVCFLLGGVSASEVIVAFLLLIASGFLYGATGIMFSSFVKNTTSSTVLTYGTILVIFGVTLVPAMSAMSDFTNAAVRSNGFLIAVNPIGAMAAGNTTEPYFGLHLPSWLTSLSLNGLIGAIFTIVALHRIEFPRTDRSGLLRALTAVFVALMSFYVCGAIAFNIGDNARGAIVYLMILPILFVPLFATGEGLGKGRIRELAFKIKQGNPVSGVLFVAMLVLIGGAFTLYGAFRSHDASGQSMGIGLLPSALSGILLTLAVILGFGGFALWLSNKLKSRWGVMAIVAASMLSAYFLPLTTLQRSAPDAHYNASVNLLYLSPAFCASEDDGLVRNIDSNNRSINSLLFLRDAPMTPVPVVLYSLLGVMFLAMTAKDRKRAS
jgi:ABC-type transport system involved in multi-copper enzyme maturation permease subunit